MKIDTRSIDRFLRSPDPAVRAVLIFGPDQGLVRERADALAAALGAAEADPFRVAELSGAALADDPARLADEANAIPFGGGRRVVRVRQAGNDCAPAFAALLKDAKGDGVVIAEGGDLDGRSALRKLAEGARNAAAIACYRDDRAALERLIAATLGAHNVAAAPDAVDYLAARLGGDRLVTRGELEKLALYAGAGGSIALDDARTLIGDTAETGIDAAVDAAGAGDPAALARALAKLQGEGEPMVSVLRAMQRHFQRLHLARSLVADGRDAREAMAALRPPVFWKSADAFRAALRRWTPAALGDALRRLLEAEIAVKTRGAAGELIAERCLLEIAARRR